MEFCQKQTTGIGFEEEFDAIKITEEKMVWLALRKFVRVTAKETIYFEVEVRTGTS